MQQLKTGLTVFFPSWSNVSHISDTYKKAHALPFEDATVTAEQVFHLINSLDTNKASGPDGISAQMLKSTAYSIASPLAKLFTLSLATGKFPKMWKTASVVPVPKSTAKNDEM